MVVDKLVPEGEAKETLKQWYLRDDNSDANNPWYDHNRKTLDE